MGAGGRYIFHDERTYEDQWGVVRRIGEDGKYVEWVSGPLTDAKDPDEYDFPGVDRGDVLELDMPSWAEGMADVPELVGPGGWTINETEEN